MEDNKKIIEKFYQSFADANVEGMISNYNDNIEFQDPVFGLLKGTEAKNMWRMLVSPKVKITFYNIQANDKAGSANWVAEYVFTPTGRRVINKIAARFEFMNGKIIKHTDYFDFWKWARQALGPIGYLFGWSSMLKNKVHRQAISQLRKYAQKV